MAWIIKCWIPVEPEDPIKYPTKEAAQKDIDEHFSLMQPENKYMIVDNEIKCFIPVEPEDPVKYPTKEAAQKDIDEHFSLVQSENIYEAIEIMTYKQVFIINSDLGMGKGKIAVQVAHAEVYYMEELLLYWEDKAPENESLYNKFVTWREEEHGLMKKVVLKATEEEMNKILLDLAVKGITKFAVYDRGLTQIAEGSFTCIVVEPLEENKCDELFGHLKLL